MKLPLRNRPFMASSETGTADFRAQFRPPARHMRNAGRSSALRLIAVLLLGAGIGSGAGEKNADNGGEAGTKQAFAESQITSDRMEMDFTGHVAKFDGNVVVKDHRMTLKTARLIAFFTADNELTKVEALGNVEILQPRVDRRAEAGHATYDVVKGTIVLTESPKLTTGDNVLSGASQITYYRNSERVVCEGGHPTIRIVPKKKPGGEKLPGLLDKLSTAQDEKGNSKK